MENNSKLKTASLHTLGCRLNQAETAIIAKNLQEQGFKIVDFGSPADLTVVNTCTVTEQADAKCRKAVRQSIRSNPDTFVAVVGCYAQMAVDTIRAIDGVDMIVGNEHKMQLAGFVENLEKVSEARVIHSPKISRNEFTIESVGLYDNNTRANLKIQDGCNFVCSFCIIAKARGPARSRKFSDVLDEAKKLVEMGHKEIVITGVNVGTYSNSGKNFLDILVALEKLNGLERIRISSIEPTTIGRELVDFMANSNKLCPYLHIPLQSGDDTILDSMRRKHDATFFKEFIQYAVEKIPHIGLGTDIMVGYPKEGELEYKNSKKLLADLPVSFFHVFTYSDREGTSSFKMTPKVDSKEKKRRYNELADMGRRKKEMFYQQFINKNLDVLFEEEKHGRWNGFTGNYLRVVVESNENLHNQIRRVKLKRIEKDRILGELV
ncbi:MAG: tRNA (N(6)-L-threonylcarbamoyladenosine(37)-C(2))-methylthiotransferase MtaB [Calditrichaeota bacterium]|nr:MAG: tRNA (N(6)-L-threonylcarbamoyladenosine(37)-C(2))-methylthiotransferase MtaB [Calditrichota bacterium]MBL1204292.1 tRNA (N(6)-L-threonylcarbamoyladenosine(37)-C(2))-methylthiotransferase MtaB [Calditrichota bacterium]NOG44122.1 tRNA (N(6)-L-threonylcarbamoyladenosine(37)-C(2))-methylthiotransferase MtaB [Calditrichota bacterium]